jgi:hypothetical protein
MAARGIRRMQGPDTVVATANQQLIPMCAILFEQQDRFAAHIDARSRP